MTKFITGVFVLAPLAIAGCANNSGNTNVACSALTPGPAQPTSAWSGTVFTIVMENHSRGDIIGNSQAPFINQLAKTNAEAVGYHDSFVHPSEPNYIWMAAGENFGILDDDDPGSHHIDSTSHIADQIELGGLTWKAYEESMGDPCGLTSHGRYAAKHNPFVYFNDVNGWDGNAFHPELRCNAHVVDYSQLDADLAANAIPRYVFITPNLDNDMHDGSISQGDAWLANEIPKITSSAAFKTGGVLFLLWDEGGGTPAGDDPPFLAISANAKPGFQSQVDYDTSSYLKTVQNVLGLAALPCDTNAKTVDAMTDLFTVPLTATP
jgi:phospholipase C